ncbi:hypothetical protein J7L29_06860, partial [Candidatus Bathyarchaeota archaeon]|nr:hypothetical protein [Candidatus Bathyarchaeota archaeon]
TFLSQIIYEGLLFIISTIHIKVKLGLEEAELPDNAFKETLNTLDSKKIETISIVFTGNDKPEKFISSLGLSGRLEKKTYRALFKFLKENAEKVRVSKNIDLTPIIERDRQVIDLLNKSKKDLAAPSIMKIERYAGFTSIEETYTTKGIGLRFSPDVWIISLLGVYSSFITRTRYAGSDKDNIYFILFSPEEILTMLARGDANYVYTLMNVKKETTEALAETLKNTHMEEAIALQLSLNLKIANILREYDIDRLKLSLVKISSEGQTYKIYEHVPLTLSSETPFISSLSTIFTEIDEVLGYLAKAVDPHGYLLRATSAKEARNWPEKDYAVKAMLALHRLASMGDVSGLRDYARYLELAVKILQGAEDGKSAIRRSYYEKLLRKIAYLH